MKSVVLRWSSASLAERTSSSGTTTDQNDQSSLPSPSVSSRSSADDFSGEHSDGSPYAYASAYLSAGKSQLGLTQDDNDNDNGHANSAAVLFTTGILYIMLAADVGLDELQSPPPVVSVAKAEPPSPSTKRPDKKWPDREIGYPPPRGDDLKPSENHGSILLCLVQNLSRLYNHSMICSEDSPFPLPSLPQYPSLQLDRAEIYALLVPWGIELAVDANAWTLGRTVCNILRTNDRINYVVAQLDKEDEHSLFMTLHDIANSHSTKSRLPPRPTSASSISAGVDDSDRTVLRIITPALYRGTLSIIHDSPVQVEFPSSESAHSSPTHPSAPPLLLKAPILLAHARAKNEMHQINTRVTSKSLFLPGSTHTRRTPVGIPTSSRARTTSLIALTRAFSLPSSPVTAQGHHCWTSSTPPAVRQHYSTLQKSPPAKQALTFTNAQGSWAVPIVRHTPSPSVWSIFPSPLSKGEELTASGVPATHMLHGVTAAKALSSIHIPMKPPEQSRRLSTIFANPSSSALGSGAKQNNQPAEVRPRRQISLSPQQNSTSGLKDTTSKPLRVQGPKRSSTTPTPPRITVSSPSPTPPTPLSKFPKRVRAETFPNARSSNIPGVAVPHLFPSLAEVERSSKLLKSSIQCAVCGEYGKDYPRCARCHEAWCSRECRIKGLWGAKRHSCKVAVVPPGISDGNHRRDGTV